MSSAADLAGRRIDYQPLLEPTRGHGGQRCLLPELVKPSDRTTSRGRGFYNGISSQQHPSNLPESSRSNGYYSAGRGRGRGYISSSLNNQFVSISRAPTATKPGEIGVAAARRSISGGARKGYGRGNGIGAVNGSNRVYEEDLRTNLEKFISDEDDLLLGPVMITSLKKAGAPLTAVAADNTDRMVENDASTSKEACNSALQQQSVSALPQRPTRESNMFSCVRISLHQNSNGSMLKSPAEATSSSDSSASTGSTIFDAELEVTSFTGVACAPIVLNAAGAKSLVDKPLQSQKSSIDLSRRMRQAVQRQCAIAVEHDVHALQVAIRQQQANWLQQQQRNAGDPTVAPPQSMELESALRASKNLLRQKESNAANNNIRAVGETLQFLHLVDSQRNPCSVPPKKEPLLLSHPRSLLYDDLLIWGDSSNHAPWTNQHLMDADFTPMRVVAKEDDLINLDAGGVNNAESASVVTAESASSSQKAVLDSDAILLLSYEREKTFLSPPALTKELLTNGRAE